MIDRPPPVSPLCPLLSSLTIQGLLSTWLSKYPPLNRSSYFASLQIIVLQKFLFPPPPSLILPPAQVLTHCNLHTCWWVTSFFCIRCVCFTPVPLLEQTALAQKATKLHISSLGSIFHPCVESWPECCNSCSAISADKTVSSIHVVYILTCTWGCIT